MGLLKKSKAPAAKPAAPASKPMKAPDMSETLFNMKFTAKQMGRLAKKSHTAIDVEKKKCKQAIETGNTEGAKIHAENAVRNQKQELSYLKLQSRIEAVTSKLEGHIKMMQVTASMGSVSTSLNEALATMDLEKISTVMDTFEKQFENLDMNAQYMDSAIGESVASSTPQNEVNQLLMQVADEHNLEVGQMMQGSAVPNNKTGVGAAKQSEGATDLSDLEKRMQNL